MKSGQKNHLLQKNCDENYSKFKNETDNQINYATILFFIGQSCGKIDKFLMLVALL